MPGDILVLAEHKNGELENITLELLSKGRILADDSAASLKVAIIGHKLRSLIEALKGNGVDTIYAADYALLEEYNPELYCRVISDIVRSANPGLLLMGYNYPGMELAPAVATKLGMGLVTNCIALELSEGAVTVTRPMFGNVIHARVKLARSSPLVISFQPGTLSTQLLSPKRSIVLPVPFEINPSEIKTKVVGIKRPVSGEIDITKADVVVAVGRGIREPSNIGLARELANALGGLIACSRPLADMGWLPPEYHVGISGKVVKPKVYIACGISGASQHISGMRDSQVIIAINKDPQAPIFQIAHYGVVADIFEILPALLREAKSDNTSLKLPG